MKTQPIPRLGQVVYPETRQVNELPLGEVVVLCVISPCVAFWCFVCKWLGCFSKVAAGR